MLPSSVAFSSPSPSRFQYQSRRVKPWPKQGSCIFGPLGRLFRGQRQRPCHGQRLQSTSLSALAAAAENDSEIPIRIGVAAQAILAIEATWRVHDFGEAECGESEWPLEPGCLPAP